LKLPGEKNREFTSRYKHRQPFPEQKTLTAQEVRARIDKWD
jgi:hypothetical protein